MDILGVKISDLRRNEVFEKIGFFLDEPAFHQIATVNPEFILEAQKNIEFKNILNNSELNIADGIGIWFAAIWNLRYLKARIAGANLVLEILRLANEKKMEIFLACKYGGLSSYIETRDAILKIYPKLNISGAEFNGHSSDQESRGIQSIDKNISELDSRLRENDSFILLCNFGAPHQEFFINSLKNDKIRLAMGVGGSFDFLTGKVTRAPKLIQEIGLEWLWRIFQPQKWEFKLIRIKRILRAVIIFPIKVIFND
jgi:N-acetylglucosaminyldiphosphoundecaprenol N-acetyl-beta-D-mannosaminyltransferase